MRIGKGNIHDNYDFIREITNQDQLTKKEKKLLRN
jgi:hypothetical protein